jgi:serine/threonine protein kinase
MARALCLSLLCTMHSAHVHAQVLETFKAGGHTCVILPLLAKSAADMAMALGPQPLPEPVLALLTMACLSAIAGLAMAGWCHGDLKPSNILFAANEVRQL